jgi:phage shock protein A
LDRIGQKIATGETLDDATESVTGLKLADNSGFEYIKGLQALKKGNQVMVAKNGQAVDYETVVGYLVQTVQDQQAQMEKLSDSDGKGKITTNTGLNLDVEDLKSSFLGQIEEIKISLETIQKTNTVQDEKLDDLERENRLLKNRLDKIEQKIQ